MDGSRFDALAKTVAQTRSRRGLLKAFAAAGAGLLAAGARDAEAAPTCGPGNSCAGILGGGVCTRHQQCVCPAGQRNCGGACVNLDSDTGHCGTCGQACRTDAGFGQPEACRDGQCVCADPNQTHCHGECVDVQNGSNTNCGACGRACPLCLVEGVTHAEECEGGQCVPPSVAGHQLANCAGACVDLRGDKHNCGACGHRCPVGNAHGCIDGQCQDCPPGQHVCPGFPGCRDLLSDPQHCNGCGHACQSDQTCVGGVCQCPADQTLCDTAGGDSQFCADLQNGNAYCGACGHRCALFGEVCRGGACVCADPLFTPCPNGCFDLQANSGNCGSCGNQCPICLVNGSQTAQECQGGQCVPPTAAGRQFANCAGACVDTQSDAANCGACGHACPAGVACVNGTCGCPSGQHACGSDCCPDGQNCCNHTCCAVGIACANDGSCAPCPSGQRLCGSACCAAANVCCGGSCCPADVAFCDGAGGCCPPERSCNGSCCPAGQSCHNGACQPRCLPSGTAINGCDYAVAQTCCSGQCAGGGRGACTPAQSWNSCCDLDGAACAGAGFNPACCSGFCSVDPGSATGTCGPSDGVRAGKVCQQNNDCFSCQCANGVCQ